jgi:hypothetical protein
MNGFTGFDAFQLCRDFARAIAVPLNGGVFARDPVLVTQLRKTIISIYSNFAEGFGARWESRVFPICLCFEGICG